MCVSARKEQLDVAFRLLWCSVVFLLPAFSGLQIRRAYRPKQASSKHGSATTVRPGFGSRAGFFSLRLPGEAGTPLTPGGLGRRRRQPPLGPGRTTTPARRRPLPAKERTGRRARCAHAARLPRAHATRTRRVSRAQPARLPTRRKARLPARRAARLTARRTARLPARRAARLPARRAACLPARERRVYDARTSASSGAHTARLRGVRSVCFLNLSVWTLVWFLRDLSGWATFALNRTIISEKEMQYI